MCVYTCVCVCVFLTLKRNFTKLSTDDLGKEEKDNEKYVLWDGLLSFWVIIEAYLFVYFFWTLRIWQINLWNNDLDNWSLNFKIHSNQPI